MDLADLMAIDQDRMAASIAASLARAEAQCAAIEAEVARLTTDPATFANMADRAGGAMHAASLMAWLAIARLAGVPAIEAERIASIPMRDAYEWMEGRMDDADDRAAPMRAAVAHADAGRWWRTDLCAGLDVKRQLSDTGRCEVPAFMLDDPRMMDMSWGMPTIEVLGRPLLTPLRIGDWPIEFRVFVGGAAVEDGAVSFYYPQCGPAAEIAAETDPALRDAAATAREWALRMVAVRDRLGILPFMQGHDFAPDARIGATIDFMLTEERGLVMVDAGPGAGAGAHPCCFDGLPIEGTRWRLADDVEPR